MKKRNVKKQDVYNRWHKELYQTNNYQDQKNTKRINKSVIQHLGITENSTGSLLDIACGKGLLLKEISSVNTHLKLYGSDISDYAIKKAKKLVDATFSVDNGEDLSLPSNAFDYVTCIGGVDYYENSVAGAKEISRVLKKDGIAVIYVANLMFLGFVWLALRYGLMPTRGGSTGSGEKIYDYNEERFFTYKGWVDILEKGGLKVISSDSYRYLEGVRIMPGWFMSLYNLFLKNLVPYNLTSTFIFVCKKSK